MLTIAMRGTNIAREKHPHDDNTGKHNHEDYLIDNFPADQA